MYGSFHGDPIETSMEPFYLNLMGCDLRAIVFAIIIETIVVVGDKICKIMRKIMCRILTAFQTYVIIVCMKEACNGSIYPAF